MANEKTYIPQQNNEEQNIDIKELIFTALHNWYLFVIFVVVALAICFVLNRYSTKVYQTSGTVLIKEGRNNYDPTAIMTTMNFGNMQNIDNEIAILKSYSLTDRVVKKMGIEVTYMEKGRISTSEMYKNSPFLVEFERSVPQAVGLPYEITFLDDGGIRLHAVGEGLVKYDYILCQQTESNPYATIDISGDYKQGEWIDNGYNRIRITKTDFFDAETVGTRKLMFWLNSYPSLNKQMGSFTVSAISKQASVASVVMNGTMSTGTKFEVRDMNGRIIKTLTTSRPNTMTAELKEMSARMKELSDLTRYAEDFKRLAPVYEELNAIIFKKKREAFAADHESELKLFYLAKRKLDAAAPDHKIPLSEWKKELTELSESYATESEKLKPIRVELKELYNIKSKLDTILRQQRAQEINENRKENHAQKKETH